MVASTALSAAGFAEAQSNVPAPWVSQDIGSPSLAGQASFSSDVFTIDAAGTDIWGTSDQFHFVYQQISGDFDIVAHVDGLTPTDAWAKAGVMIRASLAADAAHASAFITPSSGAAFQRRLTAGASSAHTYGGSASAPGWVRLVRQGGRITPYRSTDGVGWTTMGSDTISLPASVYVGLAVTSHDPATATTATLSHVALIPLSLPAPQQGQDIGAPVIAGAASFSNGTYTVSAGGTDINGVADQFYFVYQPVSGDADVILRVASLAGPRSWTKAGVMIRETLTPDSAHAFALVSVGRGYGFQRRLSAGATTDLASGGTGAAPGWLRLVRTGSRFDAYRSADGQSWTPIGSDNIPMAATAYVGIAVTARSSSAAATAAVDGFKITQGSGTNQPPAVSLTAPGNGATYAAPASIPIGATASDPDGQVSRVEFYANSTLIGTATAAPYSMTWSAVPEGTYTLTAAAFDAANATTTSAAVSITVSAAPPPPPPPRAVVFHASADHDSLVTSYTLEIFAAGADPNTATPVAAADLGKPAPDANGDITSDQSTLFSGLAAGNYIATVSAIGSGGSSRSAPLTFTR